MQLWNSDGVSNAEDVPRGTMQNYKLFVLDSAGRVIDSHPFKTHNDEAACAWAKHVAAERRFELWHEKRRVHCSHEGPSMLDQFFGLVPAVEPGGGIFRALNCSVLAKPILDF